MPTYENVSAGNLRFPRNTRGVVQATGPGDSVETFEDLSADADFNQTSASPVNTKSITAQNTFTDAVPVNKDQKLNVSVSGVTAGGGTVTLQRSFDAGSSWADVKTFTADEEGFVEDVEDEAVYRIGIKTGEYVGGTVVVRLGV